MKYGSEKNALFGGKFVWRCGMGLKVKYINAKRVCVKTKMVYHFVILNSSEGSVYIYLCLQILRFALNDRLSDSAIGVLTHPRFAIFLYIRLCLQEPAKLLHRQRPMTDFIFRLVSHLGKSFSISFGHKDRVVSET